MEEQINTILCNVHRSLSADDFFTATEETKRFLRTARVPQGKMVVHAQCLKYYIEWVELEEKKIADGDDDVEDRFSATIPAYSGFLKEISTIAINANPADDDLVAMFKKTAEIMKLAFDAKYNYTGQKPELLAALFGTLNNFFNEEHQQKSAFFYIVVRLAVKFLGENPQFSPTELMSKMMPNYDCIFTMHQSENYILILDAIKSVDKFQNDAWKKQAEERAVDLESGLKSDGEVFMILISSFIFDFEILNAHKLLRSIVNSIVSDAVENLILPQPNGDEEFIQEQCHTISTVVDLLNLFSYQFFFQYQSAQALDNQEDAERKIESEKRGLEKLELLLAKKLIDIDLITILKPLGWRAHDELQHLVMDAITFYLASLQNNDPHNTILELLETVTPLIVAENFPDYYSCFNLDGLLQQILAKETDLSSELGIAKQELRAQYETFKTDVKIPEAFFNQMMGQGYVRQDPSAPGPSIVDNYGHHSEPEVITISDDEDDCTILPNP